MAVNKREFVLFCKAGTGTGVEEGRGRKLDVVWCARGALLRERGEGTKKKSWGAAGSGEDKMQNYKKIKNKKNARKNAREGTAWEGGLRDEQGVGVPNEVRGRSKRPETRK